MKQGHFNENWNDANGNPGGGTSSGRGFTISWQNGPLGRGESRREPNGAFVEDIIDAALRRIEYYQGSKFNCYENAEAMAHLQEALKVLDSRTRKREKEGTEGTHKVGPAGGG